MAASTPDDYLATLPDDRRHAIRTVRDVVRAHLPAGFEESMSMGMIAWQVPLARLPDTYNGQPLWLAALASKKNYMALHLMTAYGNPDLGEWFRKAVVKAGKKLDMGKGCLRFKSVDALALDVVGELIGKLSVDEYVARYQKLVAQRAKAKPKKPTARARPSSRSTKSKAPPRARAKAGSSSSPPRRAR